MSGPVFFDLPEKLRRRSRQDGEETILTNEGDIRRAIGCIAEFYAYGWGIILQEIDNGIEFATVSYIYSKA